MTFRRIGLLTLPLRENYGGILQAMALYRVLRDLGHDVLLLQRTDPIPLRRKIVQSIFVGSYLLRRMGSTISSSLPQESRVAKLLKGNVSVAGMRVVADRHRLFWSRYITQFTRPISNTEGLRAAVNRHELDTIVVGSDQVWRMDYVPNGSQFDYFLEFAPEPELRKIAYAASFGQAQWAFPSIEARAIAAIRRFHAVSVREDSGLSICRDTLMRDDAQHVLDPTLLVDPKFFHEIAELSEAPSGRRSLLVYVLDDSAASKEILTRVSKLIGNSFDRTHLRIPSTEKYRETNADDFVSIQRWVREFASADFVVTDSFHGMVFSIIFKKGFLVLCNQGRGAARFTSLLNQFGLGDRLVESSDARDLERLTSSPIDYVTVHRTLNDLRESSRLFLSKALE